LKAQARNWCGEDEGKSIGRRPPWKLTLWSEFASGRVATTMRVIFPMNYIENKEQSERTVVAKPLCPKDNNGSRDGA
jgi:hypothetical protein